MIIPVTADTAPELAADTRVFWREIGNQYWQSDTKDHITLEIHQTAADKFVWWLYADDSPEPEVPVTMDNCSTIALAIDAVHDAVVSYRSGGRDDLFAAG